MNYRDYAAVGLITSYGVGTVWQQQAEKTDNDWVMQHVYTDDECREKADGTRLPLACCHNRMLLRTTRSRSSFSVQ